MNLFIMIITITNRLGLFRFKRFYILFLFVIYLIKRVTFIFNLFKIIIKTIYNCFKDIYRMRDVLFASFELNQSIYLLIIIYKLLTLVFIDFFVKNRFFF